MAAASNDTCCNLPLKPGSALTRQVSPVIAFAVTPAEYLAGYMAPFVAAAALVHPSRFTLMAAASVISLCNIRWFPRHTPG
jgi:hypothetical protein